MDKYFTRIIILLYLCFCSQAYSQILKTHSYNTLDLISEYEGLSDATVFCFHQDKNSTIWIGTKSGLNSYDGYRMTSYKHDSNDDNSLSNSDIKCFLELSDSLLYIGTHKGINVLNINTRKIRRIEQTGSYSIRFMLQDANDDMWVGTNQGVLKYKSKPNSWEKLDRDNSHNFLPQDYTVSGITTRSGDIIIGNYQYLSVKKQDSNQFENLTLPFDGASQNKMISYVLQSRESDHIIYVGTEQGLFETNIETKRSVLILSNTVVTTIEYDSQDNLWVGTYKGAYIKRKGRSIFAPLNEVQSVPNMSNLVWALFLDKDANMWIGTDNGILLTKTDEQFQHIPISDIIKQNVSMRVKCFESDALGNLWIGSANGLIRYNTKDFSYQYFIDDNKPNSLSHANINNLYSDSKSLWIATDNGLNRYDLLTKRNFKYSISDSLRQFNATWIYAIYEDDHNNLWLGTYESGLFVVNKNRLINSSATMVYADRHYHSRKKGGSISSNIVNSIVGDRQGNVWIGTDYSGVNRINTRTSQIDYYDVSNCEINSNNIKSIIADGNNTIYIATDNGLNRIEEDGAIKPVAGDRIKESIIFMTAQNDTIWFKTAGGIKRLRGDQIEHFVFDSRNYTSVYYCKNEGKIFMGTFNGISVFDPGSIRNRQTHKPVKITNILLANEPVQIGETYDNNLILTNDLNIQKSVDLRYNQNSFTIEFSSYIFQKRKESSYYYRLYGFDDQWQKNDGKDNRISFINIPPGKYQFQIRDEYAPLDEVTVLNINIARPWHSSNYAIVFYVILFVLTIWQLWRTMKVKQQLVYEGIEQKKAAELATLKADFFSNVSHDFKTPLSIIIERAGNLLGDKSNEKIAASLNSIQKNAHKIHQLINQLLEYSSKNNDIRLLVSKTSIVDFTKTVVSQFDDQFAAKNIDIRFNAARIDYAFFIDHLAMESAIGNLLSNALKFTPQGGTVSVSINIAEQDNDQITIEFKIEDSGCGIPPEDIDMVFNRYYQSKYSKKINLNGSGIGLSIVKKVITDHNGQIEIESQIGKGTCVRVYLSTSKLHIICDEESYNNGYNLPKVNFRHRSSTKPTVLIVEDNAEILEIISEALAVNFNILVAQNGSEGVELCRSKLPDIVVTDLMMPVMDGLQMCKILKENINTSLIPIIVLTAKSDVKTELTLRSSNIDAFIAKPLNVNYLEHRIVQLLSKQLKTEEKRREKQIVQSKEEVVVSSDEKIFGQITDLIESNLLDTSLNVATLCQKLGMSEKYIYRKIKSLTGLSVVEYIRSIRLKKAAMYLRQDKLSVSEIIHLVGFSNHTYFTKCFRKEYGVSPKEYVAEHNHESHQ